MEQPKQSKIKSKYLDLFGRVRGKDLLQVRAGALIVEVVEKGIEERKTAGGLFIPTQDGQVTSISKHAVKLGIVLYSGAGYYNDKGEAVPLDIQPGAVILMPTYSPKFYSTFPGMDQIFPDKEVAEIPESDVTIYYKSIEDFERAREAFNG